MYSSSGSGDVVGVALIVLVVLIGLFLLLREFFCWYWKINKRLTLMEEQNNLLHMLLANKNAQSQEWVPEKPAAEKPAENCWASNVTEDEKADSLRLIGGLDADEIIIKNVLTDKILVWDKKSWEGVKHNPDYKWIYRK